MISHVFWQKFRESKEVTKELISRNIFLIRLERISCFSTQWIPSKWYASTFKNKFVNMQDCSKSNHTYLFYCNYFGNSISCHSSCCPHISIVMVTVVVEIMFSTCSLWGLKIEFLGMRLTRYYFQIQAASCLIRTLNDALAKSIRLSVVSVVPMLSSLTFWFWYEEFVLVGGLWSRFLLILWWCFLRVLSFGLVKIPLWNPMGTLG